jgi:hypothetical protein
LCRQKTEAELNLEIADTLSTLWRRWRWLLAGAIIAQAAALATSFTLSLGVPPKLEARSIEFGAASTQVLIDAVHSPLLDLEVDVEPLLARAEVFARLAMSEPVRKEIAARSGFHPDEIVITSRSPSFSTMARSAREPAAEQRANEIAGETQVKRILFAAEEGLPIVSISAQAASPDDAVRLANAGAEGLMQYAKELQVSQATPRSSRVELRRLGGAEGGLVNSGASRSVSAMVLVAVFVFWCILVVIGSNIVEGLRKDDQERSCRNCRVVLPQPASFCPRCGVPTGEARQRPVSRGVSDGAASGTGAAEDPPVGQDLLTKQYVARGLPETAQD